MLSYICILLNTVYINNQNIVNTPISNHRVFNEDLRIRYQYCSYRRDYYSPSCSTFTSNDRYVSHENRNIPGGFQDWYGTSLSRGVFIYGLNVNVRLAPYRTRVDYKYFGKMGDAFEWKILTDWSTKLNDNHRNNSSLYFRTESKKTFNYSFEKQKSNMPGKDNYTYSYHYTYRTFSGNPSYCWNNYDSTVNLLEKEDMLFPRQAKQLRLRISGGGGNNFGFNWIYINSFTPMGISERFVYARNGAKFEEAAMCLTDYSNYLGHKTRAVVGMKCINALLMGDGREIWLMNAHPVLKRWENVRDQNLAFYKNKQTGPQICRLNDNSKESHIEFKNENTISIKKVDSCIQINTSKELKYKCGTNVVGTASSTKLMKNNEACNPLREKKTVFWWAPNSIKMWVEYSILISYSSFTEFKVKFTGKVIELGLQCYSSHKNAYYDAGNYKINSDSFETIMPPEFCERIKISILEYDQEDESNKCMEGNCLGIKRVSMKSESYKVEYTDCQNKDASGSKDQKFYFEPAILQSLYNYRNIKDDFINKFSEDDGTYRTFLAKLEELTSLKSKIEGIVPTDLAVDAKLELEPCEKGACKARMPKGALFLKALYKALMALKPRFGKLTVEGAVPGESKTLPATSCSFLKELHQVNTTGFYWIEHACNKKPEKVICEVEDRKPDLGIVVINNHELPITDIKISHELKAPELFQKVCAKAGYTLMSIKSQEDILRIVLVSLEYMFSFHRDMGIMIGFDGDCVKLKGCSGKYFSLDGTTNLNGVAKEFNGSIGKDFQPIKGNPVLILANGMVKAVSMEEASINALACSTIGNKVSKISCGVTFADLGKFEAHNVICEQECKKAKVVVEGSTMYSESSSVCRSIAHSGMFEQSATHYWAHVSMGKGLYKVFESTEQNGIMSLSTEKQQKGFTISKLLDSCPNDIVQDIEAASFMQVKSQSKSRQTYTMEDLKRLKTMSDLKRSLSRHTHDYDAEEEEYRIANAIPYDNFKQRDFDTDYRTVLRNKQRDPNLQYMYNNYNKDENENEGRYYNIPNQHYTNTKTNTIYTGNENQIYEDQAQSFNEPLYDSNMQHNVYQNYLVNDNENSDENLNLDTSLRQLNLNRGEHLNNRFNEARPGRKFYSQKEQIYKHAAHRDILNGNDRYTQPIMPLERKMASSYYNTLKYSPAKLKFDSEFGNSNFNKHNFTNDSAYSQMKRDDNTIHILYNNQNYKYPYNEYRFAEEKKVDSQAQTQPNASAQSSDNNSSQQNQQSETPQEKQKREAEEKEKFEQEEKIRKEKEEELKAQQDAMDEEAMALALYKNYTQDLRSMEMRYKEYYMESEMTDSTQALFFKKSGDNTSVHGIFKNNPYSVEHCKDRIQKWIKIYDKGIELIGKDSESLDKAMKMVPQIMKEYLQLQDFGSLLMGAANKELANALFTYKMMEDKYLSLFVYVDLDFKIDIVQGLESPLPDYWHIEQPKYASPEPAIIKVTKSKVEPHMSAIKVFSEHTDPLNSLLGLVFTTRYLREFDGDFNFSFMMPNKYSTFTMVWRYLDQFTFYGCTFSFDTPEMSSVKCFLQHPFYPTELFFTKHPLLVNTWYRVHLKYTRHSFNLHMEEEITVPKDILDKEQRNLDTEIIHMSRFYSAVMKEGKVGFACSTCKGLLIDAVTAWADKCYVQPDTGRMLIESPLAARYYPPYHGKYVDMWNVYISRTAMGDGASGFQSGVKGKKGAIVVSKAPKLIEQPTGLSMIISNKTPFMTCIDRCVYRYSFTTDEKRSINIGVAFKYESPRTNWMVIFHSGNRPRIFLKLNNKKMMTIDWVKMKPDHWYEVEISVKEESVSVKVDRKLVIDKFVDENILKMTGTLAMGVNFKPASFTDISLNLLPYPIIQKPTVPKPKGFQNSTESFDAEVEDDQDVETEEFIDPESEFDVADEKKEELMDGVCLEKDKEATRKMWCVNDMGFKGSNEKKCTDDFCNICCNTMSKQVLPCVSKCAGKSKPQELSEDAIISCESQPNGENFAVKLNACKSCCMENTGPMVSAQSIENCNNVCYKKFDKIDGPDGAEETSFVTG